MNLTKNQTIRLKEQNKQKAKKKKKQDALEHLLLNPVQIQLFHVGVNNWNNGFILSNI